MTEPDRHTILIVEDEALMLKLLKKVFERAGFRVLTARDGLEAVTICDQQNQDIALVLSDVMMPKLDGWGLYTHMKSTKPHVKMIFTSGNVNPTMEAESKERGVLDVIAKPFKLDEVLRRVQAALYSDD